MVNDRREPQDKRTSGFTRVPFTLADELVGETVKVMSFPIVAQFFVSTLDLDCFALWHEELCDWRDTILLRLVR